MLLHLLTQLSEKPVDVICWREPWLPWKQKFVNRIIEEWGLTVFDYAPSRIELCDGKDRIDVVNYYQTGPAANPEYVGLARGIEKPAEGLPWLCGLDTFLTRPVGSFDFKWNLMFHGHKSCDVDPTSGGIPLRTDLVYRHKSASASYPLRYWEDKDIFDYIREFGVPYDESRYLITEEGGSLLPDKTDNPDYYHTCLACCDRNGPDFVYCPKLRMEVNNISAAVSYGQPKAPYCSLRDAK